VSLKIKIAGMEFEVNRVETELDVCHDRSGKKLWGQISYEKQSIRILKSNKEREFRTLLHEILHGIINEYQIRELMDDESRHLEPPIDQLSLGLAEMLESVGIFELGQKREEDVCG